MEFLKHWSVIFLAYVMFIAAGVSAVSSSLNQSTVNQCNAGIQSACLALKGIK